MADGQFTDDSVGAGAFGEGNVWTLGETGIYLGMPGLYLGVGFPDKLGKYSNDLPAEGQFS